MASKTAANVARVQLFAFLAGKPVMNDFYYQYAHQPTHEDLVMLVDTLAEVVTENFIPLFSGVWEGNAIFAYDMTVNDGANAINTSIAGVAGGDPAAALPNNATLAIARKNGLRGRAGNGRIFWQGLCENHRATDNSVTAAAAAAFVTACETLDVAAEGLDATPVILSFQRDGVVSNAATIYPLVSWQVSDYRIDTQRRRIGKGAA